MPSPRSPKLREKVSLLGRGLLALLLGTCLLVKEGVAADTSFLPLQTSRLFDGFGTDVTTAVAAGPDGSAYFAGTFIGTITGSEGSIASAGSQPDVFVTKLLPDGSTAWLLKAGGTLSEKAECVTVDSASGRVYVGGQFQGTATFASTNLTAVAGSDGFVACYEANGDFVWVRQIGGSGDESVFDLKIGTDGLHVCGNYNFSASWGSTTFPASSGTFRMYLVKASLDGVPSEGIYLQSTQTMRPRRIALLADGTRVVAGHFSGTTLFGGFRASNGVDDFFAVAYEANGTFRWLITGGGAGNDKANSLMVSAGGGLLLGASVEAGLNGVGQVTDKNGSQSLPLAANGLRVARISEDGAYTPVKSITGPQMGGLVEGKRGVWHIAGNFSSAVTLGSTVVNPPGGQASIFVASYLSSGEMAGVATVSSSGASLAVDMISTSVDGLALAGSAHTTLSHNEQLLATGHASVNAFAMLLAPPELRLKLTRQGEQVHLTYPSYFYNATLWESTTLGSWTEVGTPATLTLGEMQKDFSATEAKRFFHLRYETP